MSQTDPASNGAQIDLHPTEPRRRGPGARLAKYGLIFLAADVILSVVAAFVLAH